MTTPDTASDEDDAAHEDMQRKLELVRQSYLEVLDATKHQDDKIGRFLTAIAFLTTGSIALLFTSGFMPVDYTFDGDIPISGSYQLLGWATAGFLFCVLASVAMLLLCLSSPLRLPGKQLDWGPRLEGSRLFFAYIGQEPVTKWLKRWARFDASTIERELVNQYALETHNLAERARIKYQHTHEASSLFVLALLFLGSGVVLAIAAGLSVTTPESRDPVIVSRPTTIGIGVVAATHAFAQLYVRVIHDRRSFLLVRDAARHGTDSSAGRTLAASRSTGWLLLTVPAYVLALAAPSDSVVERRVAGGVVILLLIATFALTRPRWRSSGRRRICIHVWWNGVLPAVIAGVALGAGGLLQVLGTLVAPAWLSTLTIADNFRRSRREQLRLASSVRARVTSQVPDDPQPRASGDE